MQSFICISFQGIHLCQLIITESLLIVRIQVIQCKRQREWVTERVRASILAEVSKMEGRTAKTTNLVIGGTEDPIDSDWLELDKKVRCH